jgi:hypothetical protein
LPFARGDALSSPVRRDDLLAVAALVAAWVVAVVLVDPRADVSILDDWCYAISVEQLLNGQGFHVSAWSSTFPPVHLAWGTLFAWLGGFSYTSLRVSTLVLWLVGILGAYGMLRALRCGTAAAFAGAVTFLLYPSPFVLAFSFMTDVPFIALSLLSLWALVVGLARERLGTLLGGLGLAFLAFFVRPVAIALPAGAFLGGLALRDPRLRLRTVALAIATIVVMAVASTAATRLFPWAGDGGVQYRVMRLAFIFLVPPIVYVEAAFSMMAHVGLAIVPVVVGFGSPPRRGVWWTAAVVLAAALVVSAFAPSAVSALKFAHTVSVEELGAARPLLQGFPPRTSAAAGVAFVATGVGLVAFVVLLGRVADGLRRGGWLRTPAWACIAGFGIGSAGLCFVFWFFYDRYYLPLVVVASALALADSAAPVSRRRGAGAVAVLVALALFDVTGTRDMLAYARAVTATAAELRAAGVPEIELDAGYVENGWRLYAHPERLPAGKVATLDVPHVTAKADGLPWVIANGELPGYRVARVVPVSTWWAATDRLYVLEATAKSD